MTTPKVPLTLPPNMAQMVRAWPRREHLAAPAALLEPQPERPAFVPHEQFLTPDGKAHNPAPQMLLPDSNGHDVPAYRHSIYLMRYPATYSQTELELIEEFVSRQDAHWRVHSQLALPVEGFTAPIARLGRVPWRPHPRSPRPVRWMMYHDVRKHYLGKVYPTLGHLLSVLDAPLLTSDWWTFTPDGEPIQFLSTKGLPVRRRLPSMALVAPTQTTLLRYLDLMLKN